MIPSTKRMTKTLISLRECTGWSEPLLFANPEDRFSRVEAQIIIQLGKLSKFWSEPSYAPLLYARSKDSRETVHIRRLV